MMSEAIKNFAKQFAWQPVMANQDKLVRKEKVIVCGMGGSHLAADILHGAKPGLWLTIHQDYGLPKSAPSELKDSMVILSSYSGNTEEVLDAYQTGKAMDLPMVAIAEGGKLLNLARADEMPYIQIPTTDLQPRSALGYSLLSFLHALGEQDLFKQAVQLADVLDPLAWEKKGKELARRLQGKIPIIYSSRRNKSIAYNWKIKFNETGKIPAFYNVLPELNHNEMTGFDVQESSKKLSENFYFIFLKNSEDDPRINKRMEILQQLYQQRGLSVQVLDLTGKSWLEKIFSSLLLADWAALYTAEHYGLEPEQVPMVEEFKHLI